LEIKRVSKKIIKFFLIFNGEGLKIGWKKKDKAPGITFKWGGKGPVGGEKNSRKTPPKDPPWEKIIGPKGKGLNWEPFS